MKKLTKLGFFMGVIMFLMYGCKFESGDGNSYNESGNTCSCCYVAYFDSQNCWKCTEASWPKKSGETCKAAAKRSLGVDPYCCNNSSYQWKQLEDKMFQLANNFSVDTNIFLASSNAGTSFVPSHIEVDDNIETKYNESCQDVCSDPDNPFCLTISSSSANNILSQVIRVGSLFEKETGIIKRKEIMTVFDVDTDPCERTDTILDKSEIRNDGQECLFKSTVNIASSKERLFTFYMPTEIRGIYKNNDQNKTIVFKNKKNTFSLQINKSKLNLDFGGFISSLLLSDDTFVVGTENGCILLK